MENWKKRYIAINAVIVVTVAIATIIFVCSSSHFAMTSARMIKVILSLISLLIEFSMIVFLLICGMLTMKRGFYNISKCDDELFEQIDQYKRCWAEDKYFYIKQIQIINLYYKKDGKVDELVENKEIEKLYARADFLLEQNSLFDNLMTYFYSLVISIIATFVCQIAECENGLLMFVCLIIITFLFFGIILTRYAEKGQMGLHRHYVDEYERTLLLQKIDDLEKKLTISDADEQILEMKQVVINELIRIRQKKIQKKKLENDIKCVQQLDLCMGDYSKFYVQKIYINGMEGCLLYDLEKGKENNYIGELNLINQEYSRLYQILNRYDLISYFEKI